MRTVAQVVPAVVIAIFVFAAGTSFVVAQVVPQARGTRAFEMLRGRHVAWTVSPALALTPLSMLVLALVPTPAESLALALLSGSLVYLLCSTACLLAILREATDPLSFAGLLRRKYQRRLKILRSRAAASLRFQALAGRWQPSTSEAEAQHQGLVMGSSRRIPRRNAQSAVDDLHAIVRTLRGWARTAATSGDSRDLSVAPDATLGLVVGYAAEYGTRPTHVRKNSGLNAPASRVATNPAAKTTPHKTPAQPSQRREGVGGQHGRTPHG